MRRVVVTGMGIVSCLGNDLAVIERSLRSQRSGIGFAQEFETAGLRSRVRALPDLSNESFVERRYRRFMGDPALYAYHAMRKAVAHAQLAPHALSDPRVGLIVGSGVGSVMQLNAAIDVLRAKGLDKVSPYAVPQIMGSTTSACLATAFRIHGASYSISAACATSAHCIGHAMELIRFGKQDLVFAGGAEEVRWPSAAPFDAMGVLSTSYNHAPHVASRPYDIGRDGFVIAGGGGILVLEALDHAQARNARIHAELVGYGACSDGMDMTVPTSAGAARAMRAALAEAGLAWIDYINTHGTSTPAGDLIELAAIRDVFQGELPLISSTKGLTGHALGASGVHEAIYSIIMMNSGFIAPCANLQNVDPGAKGYPLVMQPLERKFETFMSNSLGFGGSNACLVFRRTLG